MGDNMSKLLNYEDLMTVRRWHLLNFECAKSHADLEVKKEHPDIPKLNVYNRKMREHKKQMAEVDIHIQKRHYQTKVGDDGFRIVNS